MAGAGVSVVAAGTAQAALACSFYLPGPRAATTDCQKLLHLAGCTCVTPVSDCQVSRSGWLVKALLHIC